MEATGEATVAKVDQNHQATQMGGAARLRSKGEEEPPVRPHARLLVPIIRFECVFRRRVSPPNTDTSFTRITREGRAVAARTAPIFARNALAVFLRLNTLEDELSHR